MPSKSIRLAVALLASFLTTGQGGFAAAPAAVPVAARSAPAKAEVGAWPRTGRIAYTVLRGENGLKLGEGRHRWSHDGQRYNMETVLETTGLAGAIYDFHYVQRSEGRVLASGLQPERFSVDQQGKAPEVAEFDWSAAQVTIRRKGKTRQAALHPGDQDVLSLWHQVGLAGVKASAAELTVVTGKVAAPSSLAVVGRETIQLPIGPVKALRVKAKARNGSLTLDIWLAEDRHFVPVRIVMTDDKGEVLDQQATEIELGPSSATAG